MLTDHAPCPPLAFHVTLRPVDHRVIVLDAADRRAASGVILARGDDRGLLLHDVSDTHAHALLATDRASAGRFAHDVEASLRWHLRIPVPFEPASIRPIRTQGYLGNSFWYIADQRVRHGVSADPALDGSSVLDLVGARTFLVPCGAGVRRVGATLRPRVASLLPRVQTSALMERLGGRAILDGPPELEDLAEAAAAAVGLTDLQTRGPVRSAALAAALMVGHRYATTALSDALLVTRRTIQRHRHVEPLPEVVRAVALQWRIRAHLRREADAALDRLLTFPEASCVRVDADGELAPPDGARARDGSPRDR